MKSILAFCLAAYAWVFASELAAALDPYPASDPRSVIETVISLSDRRALPGWDEPSFQNRLRPYLSDDFLRVVAKGARTAIKNHINLYDGDFFTGSQEMAHAKLFDADVVEQEGDTATVEATVGTSGDPAVDPKQGGKVRYELKRVGGVWKIDDFRFLEDWAKSLPSLKTMFSDPMKYGE